MYQSFDLTRVFNVQNWKVKNHTPPSKKKNSENIHTYPKMVPEQMGSM